MAIPFPYQRRRKADDAAGFMPGESGGMPYEAWRKLHPEIPTGVDRRYTEVPIDAPPLVQPAATTRAVDVLPPAADPYAREWANRNAQQPIATPPSEPTTEELGAPPVMVTTDKRGRPQTAIGGEDAAERRKVLGEHVDAYQPKAEPKWYHYARLAGLLGSTFLGAVGHDERAVAQSAAGFGRHAFNPKAVDEDWRTGKRAEIDAETNQDIAQRRGEAQIKNLEDQPILRRETNRLRQVGLDTAGRRVDDARMKAALDQYHKNDYTPGENPALDKYYEDSGLHSLPARKAADKWEYKLINGDLLRVPKSGTGGAENVTFTPESGGGLVNDPGLAHTESVTIGDQTFPYLTTREAALMTGKHAEAEANRESAETRAAAAQTGANQRAAMRGPAGIKAGAINPTIRGAVAALSRFRSITADIETKKFAYGENHAVVKALYDKRDGLERDMKQLYGNYLELDDKGKPRGLKESAYTAEAGPTIEGAIEAFKTNPKNPTHRAPTAAEIATMQAKIDAQRK